MTATGGGRPQGRPEESRESLPAPSGPYRRPTLAGVLGLVAPHDHGEERRLLLPPPRDRHPEHGPGDLYAGRMPESRALPAGESQRGGR
jgi:hypothetical protein